MSGLEALEAQLYRESIQKYPTITVEEAIAGGVHPHANLQENDLVRDQATGECYRVVKSSPRTNFTTPQPERDTRTG